MGMVPSEGGIGPAPRPYARLASRRDMRKRGETVSWFETAQEHDSTHRESSTHETAQRDRKTDLVKSRKSSVK